MGVFNNEQLNIFYSILFYGYNSLFYMKNLIHVYWFKGHML